MCLPWHEPKTHPSTQKNHGITLARVTPTKQHIDNKRHTIAAHPSHGCEADPEAFEVDTLNGLKHAGIQQLRATK
jgi:hypothetical protein